MRSAVIIPAYNAAETLPETLESLQATSGLEEYVDKFIIRDDASEDDTVEQAKRVWSHETPLQIRCNESNRGERLTINAAIKSVHAEADWVFILHADDLVKEHWLPTMVEVMENAPDNVASVCSSYDELHEPEGRVEPGENDCSRGVEHISGTSESVRDSLHRGCWWHLSGCSLRVDALSDIGLFDPTLSQVGDWDWMLRCLAEGYAIRYVPRTLTYYRRHEETVSAQSFHSDRDLKEKLNLFQRYRSYLSTTNWLKIHAKTLEYVVRRIGRSTLNQNWSSVLDRASLATRIVQSALSR